MQRAFGGLDRRKTAEEHGLRTGGLTSASIAALRNVCSRQRRRIPQRRSNRDFRMWQEWSQMCQCGARMALAQPVENDPHDLADAQAQSTESAEHRTDRADRDARQGTQIAVFVTGTEAALEVPHSGDVVCPPETMF